MHHNLTCLSSNFKFPRISRLGAVSGNDARLRGNYFRHLWRAPCCYYDRNVESRRDVVFNIPDLTEPPASTSAAIVNAGLNKIWRNKSKAPRAFTGSPVPQPAAVQPRNHIPSSAVKGLESTQRNIGLDLFTAGQNTSGFYSSSRRFPSQRSYSFTISPLSSSNHLTKERVFSIQKKTSFPTQLSLTISPFSFSDSTSQM